MISITRPISCMLRASKISDAGIPYVWQTSSDFSTHFLLVFAGNYLKLWQAVTDWQSLWCNLDRINAFCHIIFYKIAIKPLWDDVFVDSDRLRVTPYGVSQSYTYSSIISVLTKVFLFFSFAIWNDRVDFSTTDEVSESLHDE